MISVREIKLAIATEIYTDEIKEALSIFDNCVIYCNKTINNYVVFVKDGTIILDLNCVEQNNVICVYSLLFFKSFFYENDIQEVVRFLIIYYLNIECLYVYLYYVQSDTRKMVDDGIKINKLELLEMIRNL